MGSQYEAVASGLLAREAFKEQLPYSNRPTIREPAQDATNVAEYIAEMTAELAHLAGSARFDILTYFLNMARMEAETHIGPRS